MKKRVVITGVGLVTPLGIGVAETWSALCAGKSGIDEITRFDTTNYQTKIAGEVRGFRNEDWLVAKEANRTELFIAYAIAASRMAIEDSGLKINGS
ncbi:MAG: beta-ketoacyl synthase N-terminal-like domain-containing protein, partial [Desulfobacterales bacterium]